MQFLPKLHNRGKCPTYGKVCQNCNSKNYFKKCSPRNRKTLDKIEQNETESPSTDECELFLDTINLQRDTENLVNISQIKNDPSDWIIA